MAVSISTDPARPRRTKALLLLLTAVLASCDNGTQPSADTSSTSAPTSIPVSSSSSEAAPPNEPQAEPLKPDTAPDPMLPAAGSPGYQSAAAAARFLTQATFGPTAKSVAAAMSQSRAEWIEGQMALPQTFHLALLDERLEEIGLEVTPDPEPDEEGWIRDLQRSDIWWESAIWGKDQLRQKVAYALSQILVISNVSDVLFNDSRGIANYHDLLASHAFGNYRDLLESVTLNPMMGEYLSMVRNEKANASRNIRPDENYARELMQLFSIGLVQLNPDGTPISNAQGQPIPTYTQDDIKNLARVFTGWNMATVDNWWQWTTSGDAEILPMKAFPTWHDSGEKVLFGEHVIPANQTPEQDLDDALDIIFHHPNVGPFISKQLIQKLVTSNPSPAYVARVASAFNNNGQGVRGDMGAVVKAILLDEEAINGHQSQPETFGKLREPLLKITALWRAFKAQGVPVTDLESDDTPVYQNRLRFRGSDRELGQRPYGAFSVFNYYRPDYQQPGEILDQDLLSPEFQIMTESQMISATSYLAFTLFWRDIQNDWPKSELVGHTWDVYPSQLYLKEEKAIAHEPAVLLERANLLLMSGQMSKTMFDRILAHTNQYRNESREIMVYETLLLVAASPEFAVQR